MKKLITFLSICVLAAFSYTVKGQLVVFNQQTSVSGGDSTVLVGQASIKNTSNSSVSLRVRVMSNNLTSGHQSYFCWGTNYSGINCYPAGTLVSPVNVVLPPDSSGLITADADPRGTIGTDSVSYLIYDINDSANNKILISFKYDFTTGIKELNPAASSFLNCTQSNSEDATNITYSINNFKDGKIVIRNLTGATVKEIRLNDKQGVLSVSTVGLPAGIYMYALYNNNEPVAIRKTVIWRR